MKIPETFTRRHPYFCTVMKRRNFVALGAAALTPVTGISQSLFRKNASRNLPVVISTWSPNVKANARAWDFLKTGSAALDAVVAGVKITEADPEDQSVGYGGLPDRDGKVTLDACVMDHLGNIGAVMCLEHIKHPVSVARLVMEKTPHVQLVGEGALKFALENGFQPENLLTEKSKKHYGEWLKTGSYSPSGTVENILQRIKNQHDTIGMLAIGSDGNIAGACSTSGMAYKMAGRVGDSPIIGAGLYVDNEIGAATATGNGEEVIRVVGSHSVVEYMRHGYSPTNACKAVVERFVKLRGQEKAAALQIGFIALNKNGETGCYALNSDFTMAVHDKKGSRVIQSPSML